MSRTRSIRSRRTGDPVGAGGSSETEFLERYDPTEFPPVAVSVDLVVLTIRDGKLCILLVRRAGHPFQGRWALPGGFLDADSDRSLDAAAERELAEETGLDVVAEAHLEQLRTYGDAGRDPRVRTVTTAYLAMMPDLPLPSAASDAAAARWWALAELPEAGPLAFDHERIIADGVERARAKLEYTTLAISFVRDPFTISDLRSVYETVWGVELHAENFARKVRSTPGFAVPTGAKRRGRPGPAAALYIGGGATTLAPPLLRPQRGVTT